MQVQPYLFFEGRCDEALAFYGEALGAEVTALMRYRDCPETPAATNGDKVMHAEMRIGSAAVMASDGHCSGATNFQGFGLTLPVPDEATATRLFDALAKGGDVRMPLARTFFSPSFGMVSDKFGVLWMVMAQPKT